MSMKIQNSAILEVLQSCNSCGFDNTLDLGDY